MQDSSLEHTIQFASGGGNSGVTGDRFFDKYISYDELLERIDEQAENGWRRLCQEYGIHHTDYDVSSMEFHREKD